MKNATASFLLLLGLLAATILPARGQYTDLHDFLDRTEGYNPNGSLTLSGSTLYGATSAGGGPANQGNGSIFSINTDGTGLSTLHNFSQTADGSLPNGSLALSGSVLYGTAQNGGTGGGTIFSMSADGSNFTVLHDFSINDGGVNDGIVPVGGLTLSGSVLYGATNQQGSFGVGTIFKMNTDGSGFTVLKAFNSTNGANPVGSLTLSGSVLYGVTTNGRGSGDGEVFKMNTDGTGFTFLRTFQGGTSDGAHPLGALTLSGSVLYGTTNAGGANNLGTIFAMNTDGTGFTILKSLDATSGEKVIGALTLSGSTLYGTASTGGTGPDIGGDGTLFSLGTDGSNFTVLENFTGEGGSVPGDGANGGMILSGSTLYGTSGTGGNADGNPSNEGVLFSQSVPEPSAAGLLLASAAALLLPRARFRARGQAVERASLPGTVA